MSTDLESRIKARYDVITVADIYDMLVTTSSLNPNPIYQRNSTISDYNDKKNQGIIEAILRGFGIDIIIVRDISVYDESHPIRVLYPNYKFLVVDGGHRCRAIKWFIDNKFQINIDGNLKFYRDLTEKQKKKIREASVLMKYIICSSEDARDYFWTVNKMTMTTVVETIMADDVNPVCRWIREHTWYYPEYKNLEKIHPIFKVSSTDKFQYVTDIWNKPNTGGSFFYHALITLVKSIGEGNVNAGQKAWEKLVSDEKVIPNEAEKIWTRFFDDLLEYQKITRPKDGINDDIFGFFSCVWFELLDQYGIDGFKFEMDKFAEELASKRAELTNKFNKNKQSQYDYKMIKNLDGKEEEIKSVVREYIKAFSHGKKMKFVGKLILAEMDNDLSRIGVTVMHKRKSLSKKNRELLLNMQKNRCYIDGKSLKLEDAEAGHIVAVSMGGTNDLSNLKMIRKSHNRNMGSTNIEDYKKTYREKYV